MKAAAKKKVMDIRGRVRDLKATYVANLEAEDPKERLIPRVSGIVIREGLWLVKVCKNLSKANKPTPAEEEKIKAAEAWFKKLFTNHEDEVERNLFIFRMKPDFIDHLEQLVIIARRLDALQAVAAASNMDDDEAEEELSAEMTA